MSDGISELRLPTESLQAHQAVFAWLQSVDRNISEVARQLSKSRQLLTRWSRQFRWKERAFAHDVQQARIRQEAAQKAIVEVTTESVRQYELSAQRTVREAAAVAFSHVGQAARWDGSTLTLLPSEELPPEVLAAVKKVTVRDTKEGKIQQIEFHDKLEALRLLGNHQRLWNDKETEAEATQRNNFLIFINAMQSGELDHIVERITGEKLPPPPGKEAVEIQLVSPRKSRD